MIAPTSASAISTLPTFASARYHHTLRRREFVDVIFDGFAGTRQLAKLGLVDGQKT
jgi:hypothetical protein